MSSGGEDQYAGEWGPKNTQELNPNRGWAASRRRYEWDESYGEGIAPRDMELEKELFGEESHIHSGINFSKYDEIKVTVNNNNRNIRPFSTVIVHFLKKKKKISDALRSHSLNYLL